MNAFFTIVWVVFWVYWLISAANAKRRTRRRARPVSLIIIALAAVLIRLLRYHSLAVHAPVLQVVGVIVFLSGLGLAVWARIVLGRNWGMPMTEKEEPELVTSGPYHVVRHPIYSGILLAVLGTSLATDLLWLIVLAVIGSYFIYSATVEEKLLTSTFPTQYPDYKTHTKMLIPFVI